MVDKDNKVHDKSDFNKNDDQLFIHFHTNN
jgi:hypothetical protein